MNIIFDPGFDGEPWTGPVLPGTASVGEAWIGPSALLERLETALGLGGIREPFAVRAAALVPALRDRSGFWSRSAEVDPLGTARELLRWRDALCDAGWSNQGGAQRLSELAVLTRDVLPGPADRLAAVRSTLAQRRGDVTELVLLRPADRLPWCWQEVVRLLEARGTIVRHQPLVESAAEGDLLAARRPGFNPRGDGSLLLLRPQGPLDAAEEIAAWLAAQGSLDSTVIIGSDLVLDRALRRFGLPTVGGGASGSDSALLQVLPLVLQLAWMPPDPDRALELLTLPVSPVRPSLAYRLASTLRECPAVDSDPWRQTIRAWLAGISDPEERKAMEERLRAIFGPEGQTVHPAAELEATELEGRIALVRKWLRGRLVQAQEAASDVRAWDAAIVQCEVLSQLLQYTGMKRISAPQLRRLVEEATEAAPASGLFDRQAGPGRVHSPSAVVGPAHRVVWWAFRRDQAPQVRPLPWSRAESEALAAAGVHLPDPAMEAIENARAWRRPLLLASSSLVMVCPRLGEDGEEIYPHPLWDELVAGPDPRAASSKLERCSAPYFPELAKRQRTSLALPRVVEIWPARKGAIVPRTESPTSLGTLVGCPLKWVLEHTGHVRSGAAASLPADGQLWGSLAHEIVARVLSQPARSPEEAASTAERLFDDEGPRLAAALFRPGSEAKRAEVRQTVARATRSLASFIERTGSKKIHCEEAVPPGDVQAKLRGRPDIALEDPGAIIDLKWTSRSYYRDLLKQGAAYQVAAYSYLRRQKKRPEFPPVAYFILREQRWISTDSKAFPDAEAIDGPGPKETWEALEKACAKRWTHLAEGQIARGDESAAAGIVGGVLTLPPSCRFCDYGALCGRLFETEATASGEDEDTEGGAA